MNNAFFNIKVLFKDYFKEFEYIKSYDDFLKKLHEIFNLSETIELKIFYINEDEEKILINNNDEYSKCKHNDDGYYIYEMEIKDNKNENGINNVIEKEKEKEESQNIKPTKIKIKYEKEENEFDYTEDYDNFIEECKFQFNISEMSLLNLYNTNKSEILVQNKTIYNSLIPDKDGCLFFELKFNPKEEKFISISKVSQSEINDKFDESNINKENISLNKLKFSFSDFNNYCNNNYIFKTLKENMKNKCKEFTNKYKDYLNLKLNEINQKVNEKFRNLNQFLSKQENNHKNSYSNEIINYKIKRENNFSLIKTNKNTIPFLKKNLIIHKEPLKKYSCEFRKEKYYFKFNQNPPLNKYIGIKVKNNGENIWPKTCVITLNNNKNKNIGFYGVTKSEVNINEEITIQMNLRIDIPLNNSFKSSLKIWCKDCTFSFNNCEIEFEIDMKKNCSYKIIPRNRSKLLINKLQWNNGQRLFNQSKVDLQHNLSEQKYQLKHYYSYDLKSKKKIIKENKNKSKIKPILNFHEKIYI